MHMKSVYAADTSKSGITGSTKTHIVSRLEKARKNAAHLQDILRPKSRTSRTEIDYLEASAYALMLLGSLKFEARRWQDCLDAHSQVNFIYTALSKSQSPAYAENFRSLLSNHVEPSIRYAAYQSKLPRTMSIATIALRHIPKDADCKAYLSAQPSSILDGKDTESGSGKEEDAAPAPSSITWRTRTVKIEHANISQALAAVSSAEKKMSSEISLKKAMPLKDRAAAYDHVLIPSQDAVDATKDAIAELESESVSIEDSRMQALYVTRTAANYSLIGWRIGRNRVLCGRADGSHPEIDETRAARDPKVASASPGAGAESRGRTVKRLKERVVLFDGILQSLESSKDLRGVAADQQLVSEIDSKTAYFSAIRLDRDHS